MRVLPNVDQEIFDRLFTLFDKTGAGKVNYLELVVSLSLLIPGTLNDRLLLGFTLCDDEGKVRIRFSRVEIFLRANSTPFPPSPRVLRRPIIFIDRFLNTSPILFNYTFASLLRVSLTSPKCSSL